MCYKKSDQLYIFGSLFILFLFVHMAMEQALLSHPISLYLQNSVTSHFQTTSIFFIVLPFVHLPVPKKKKTCDIKQKLFI